jgi:hypothetical protein
MAMNYQNATQVDKNNLDEEAIQIPGWYGNVVEKEAIASDRWDALKDKLSVLKADIQLTIRGWDLMKVNLFFDLQLVKLTEEVYKNLVYIHPEILALYNEIAEARHKALLYRAATKAFDKKADMLKELAKLYSQGYFMKIEGQAYHVPKVDLLVEKLKEQTIKRIQREDAGKVPAPTQARTALESKIEAAKKGASGATPKTPKTPKSTKRVRG